MSKISLTYKNINRQLKARMPRPVLDAFNRLSRFWRSNNKTPALAGATLSWRRWLVLGAIFSFGAIIVILPIVYYQSINISRFLLDTAPVPFIASDKKNILLLGYEESNEYYFVNFIAVMRLDPQDASAKIVLVHPDLAVRTKYGYEKMRNILAQTQLHESEDEFNKYLGEIEVMLGMQIDRYLAVNTAQIIPLMQAGRLNYKAAFEIADPDIGAIQKDQALTADELPGYLAANAKGFDAKMQRQAEFIKSMISTQRHPLALILGLWELPNISKRVTTNATRVELFNWISHLWQLKSWKVDYIKINDTYFIEGDKQQFYVPNIRLTDDRIMKLIASNALLKEQARIEIYNATETNGLAGKTERWLRNLGANVVRAGNYPERLDQTVVYDPSGVYPQNIALIRSVTRGEVEVLDQVFPYNHTGELILILGADITGK